MQVQDARLKAALESIALPAATAMVALAGGGSQVFRLDLADGTSVVLKRYPPDMSPRSEARIAARLREATPLVPQFLLADDSLNTLPFPFAITSHVAGMTGGSLRDHKDIASLYRQMGDLLRKLHTVPMPAYGFSSEAQFSTNEAFVRHLADDSLTRFVALGGNADLAARLERIIAESFEAVVPHARGPAFAHNDLHPNNVLATETGDGKLVLNGIIDFGSAGAADPLFDLSKCLLSSEHDAPGSARHILNGYGPLDHPEPDKALAFYTLLHRVIMWWWLRQAGTIASPDAPSDLIDDLERMAA